MKTPLYPVVLLLASLAHAQEPAMTTPQQDQETTIAQHLIDRHFAIWNDTNSSTRLPQYPAVYTTRVFVADYAGNATGYAAVDRMIDAVHAKFPGYRFTSDPIAWNHGLGRVTWGYGPAGDPGRIRGEDIFTIEDGRIASARVFIDKQ